jgi:hypothetical protein
MSVTWYPIAARKLLLRFCGLNRSISLRSDTLFSPFSYLDRAWKFFVINPIFLYPLLRAFLSRHIEIRSCPALIILQRHWESAGATCTSKQISIFMSPVPADIALAAALLALWNQLFYDCDINFKGSPL